MRALFTLVLLAVCAVCPLAQATVHNVPAQYSTIQAAVDAATDGDTVLVAAGVYNEAVTVDGRGINLFGAGSEEVTINSDGLGACVTIVNPTATPSIVRGLTLYRGEGVRVWNSVVATVEECCISQCQSFGSVGGGITVHAGASVVIRRNRIAYNRGSTGGIMGDESTLLIHDNLIVGNVGDYYYGAVRLRICKSELRHNTIIRNPTYGDFSFLGAVQTEGGDSITLVDNIVAFNKGHGIALWDSIGYLIEHNDVFGNRDSDYVTRSWSADIGGSSTNISTDPQLLEPDYLPQAGSPVIGAASDGGNMGLDSAVAGCSPLVIDPVCGNGIIEFGELCDDGNTIPGDSCDEFCHEEYPCPMPRDVWGDVNADGVPTAADVITMVGWIFKQQGSPTPCDAAGDVNCDGIPNAADIITEVNFVFKSQPLPCHQCESPMMSEC